MCRCLQSLWEDFYWNCIEEKFCFDETIAYYNPDEDEEKGKKKSGKNSLSPEAAASRKSSEVIINQPLRMARHCSTISSKMHEDDFQREIQTTVPILAPEVLAAFAHSQIFNDTSQKPKSKIMSSKSNFLAISYSKLSKSSLSISSYLSPSSRHNISCASIATPSSSSTNLKHKQTTALVHPPSSARSTPSLNTNPKNTNTTSTKYTFPLASSSTAASPTPSRSAAAMSRANTRGRYLETPAADSESAAEKLLARLEEGDDDDVFDRMETVRFHISDGDDSDHLSGGRTKTFESIVEEDESDGEEASKYRAMSVSSQQLSPISTSTMTKPAHPRLKQVQSVPHFPTFPKAGKKDSSVYVIPVSMTPEIPTISLKSLPRNYQDTPSTEYRESSSLTSIQMENKRRGEEIFNFEMPRYYGHSELYLPTPAISQEDIDAANANVGMPRNVRRSLKKSSLKKNKSMLNLSTNRHDSFSGRTAHSPHRAHSPGDKGNRLKTLRGHLPPLLIHPFDKTKHKDRE